MLGIDDPLDKWRKTPILRRFFRKSEITTSPDEFINKPESKYNIQPYYTPKTKEICFDCDGLVLKFQPFHQETFECWDALTCVSQNGKKMRSKTGINATYAMASNIYLALTQDPPVKVERVECLPEGYKECMAELAGVASRVIGVNAVKSTFKDWGVKSDITSDVPIDDTFEKTYIRCDQLEKLNLDLKHELQTLKLKYSQTTEQHEAIVADLKSKITQLEKQLEDGQDVEQHLRACIEKLEVTSESMRQTNITLASELRIVDLEKAKAQRGDLNPLLSRMDKLREGMQLLGLSTDGILDQITCINRLADVINKYTESLNVPINNDADEVEHDNKLRDTLRGLIRTVNLNKLNGTLYEEFIRKYPPGLLPDSTNIGQFSISTAVLDDLKASSKNISDYMNNPHKILKLCIKYQDIHLLLTFLKKWDLRSKIEKSEDILDNALRQKTGKSVLRPAKATKSSAPCKDEVEDKQPKRVNLDKKTKKLLQFAFCAVRPKPYVDCLVGKLLCASRVDDDISEDMF